MRLWTQVSANQPARWLDQQNRKITKLSFGATFQNGLDNPPTLLLPRVSNSVPLARAVIVELKPSLSQVRQLLGLVSRQRPARRSHASALELLQPPMRGDKPRHPQ